MSGVNKVILIGNLGADPELRSTPSGTAVANLRIATNEFFTNQSGERDQRTEWHRIVAFGRLAEICGQYLKKGKQVYIEGRLRTREWEDQGGNRRFTTEITATQMVMLGTRGDAEYVPDDTQAEPAEEEGVSVAKESPEEAKESAEEDDDLPF